MSYYKNILTSFFIIINTTAMDHPTPHPSWGDQGDRNEPEQIYHSNWCSPERVPTLTEICAQTIANQIFKRQIAADQLSLPQECEDLVIAALHKTPLTSLIWAKLSKGITLFTTQGNIRSIQMLPNKKCIVRQHDRITVYDYQHKKNLARTLKYNKPQNIYKIITTDKMLIDIRKGGWVACYSLDNLQLIRKFNCRSSDAWSDHIPPFAHSYSREKSVFAVSKDSEILITGHDNGIAKIWDLETGECLATLDEHYRAADRILITKDKKHVISGSRYDKALIIWDVKTGKCLQKLPNVMQSDDPLYTLVLNKDDTMLYVQDCRALQAYELNNGHLQKKYNVLSSSIFIPSFIAPLLGCLACGNKYIIMGKNGATPNSSEIIDAATGNHILRYEEPPETPNRIRLVRINNNDTLALTATFFRTSLWDVQSGDTLLSFRMQRSENMSAPVCASSISTNNQWVAVATSSNTVELWSTYYTSLADIGAAIERADRKAENHTIKPLNLIAGKSWSLAKEFFGL